jgi:hypothetical protein
MKFKIIVKKNINMTKIKINIKNKAFFQVTRIRRHGKLNFGLLIFFAYLIPVILRFYVLILNFIFIMLQSLRVQRREREIPEKKEREHFVIYIMIIKKISFGVNRFILKRGSSMRMMLCFEYKNVVYLFFVPRVIKECYEIRNEFIGLL